MLFCYIYLRQLKCVSYKRTTHLSWTSNVPSSILEGASSSNENASVTSRNPSHVFHPVLLPMSAQKDVVLLPVNACNTANARDLYRHKVAAIMYVLQCTYGAPYTKCYLDFMCHWNVFVAYPDQILHVPNEADDVSILCQLLFECMYQSASYILSLALKALCSHMCWRLVFFQKGSVYSLFCKQGK